MILLARLGRPLPRVLARMTAVTDWLMASIFFLVSGVSGCYLGSVVAGVALLVWTLIT